MTKEASEIRFEKARKRLSHSLKELEKITIEKLHETVMNAKMINTSADHESKIIEQEATIQNLNEELNNIQKALAEAGSETEFYNEKNKALSERMNQFRVQSLSLVNVIESDLSKIYSIIKREE